MKKTRETHWLAYLAAFIGVPIALWKFVMDLEPGRSGFEALQILALSVAGYFACILIHEIGHALFAVSAGWNFHFLTAGPLMIERKATQKHFGLNRPWLNLGGVTLCTPPDRAALERGIARYCAGGPIASLLFALLLALIGLTLGDRFGTVLQTLVWITASFSAATALTTWFLPGETILNDGERFRRWRRGDPRARSEFALLLLTGQTHRGVRPRDLSHELLEELHHDDSSLMLSTREFLLAQVEFDRGQRTESLERLERLATEWEDVPSALRSDLAIEIALCQALVRDDSVQAHEWLARTYEWIPNPWRRTCAEAAIRLAEGEPSAAGEALATARKLAAQSVPSLCAADTELMDEIEGLVRRQSVEGP